MFINQNLWSCLCSNQFLSNSVMEESSQCHCVSLVDGEQYFFFIFFSVQKLIWQEVTLKEPKDLKLFRISRMLSWCFFLHSDSLMCRQIKKEFTFFDVHIKCTLIVTWGFLINIVWYGLYLFDEKTVTAKWKISSQNFEKELQIIRACISPKMSGNKSKCMSDAPIFLLPYIVYK